MVRVFSVIILLVIISCSTKKNEFRQERFNSGRFSIKPLSETTLIYKVIDTSSVYELVKIFHPDLGSKEDKEINFIHVIKFYKNGRVADFNSKSTDLSKELLNPKKAKMGFYKFDKNQFQMEFITNSSQSGHFLSKSTLIIKSDSIIEENGKYKYMYVKKTIPKEWLVYKPDW